ncbi:Dynamin related protein [Klebsormidium nitens]|uniref:dynamin GTPase n=1 Tax=Klebsormidium nitens TaxID=105231 RepID=A0A1Y1IEQ8_KLENI|nr:Dynamin related protein [Klebsormidium nitens]|eukprot:GAQ87226.1 Dynamin related protein [Klebsormidium nitens]
MEGLIGLSELVEQAQALLGDADSSGGASTFLRVVALGSVGSGKTAVLNSLLGYPVLPTGKVEGGATRIPLVVNVTRSGGMGVRAVLGNRSLLTAGEIRRAIQGEMKKGLLPNVLKRGSKDLVELSVSAAAAPPLTLVDLPGILDKASERDDLVTEFAGSNDAILLVALPAQAAPGVANTRVLRFAQELDPDGSRTVGVLTRVDQAAGDARALSATSALLQGQGPGLSREIPWVATITKAQADVSADESLAGSFQAELDMLRNILGRGSQLRLGRTALIEALFATIRNRTKQKIPTLLAGLEGRSAQVEEELVRLGERRATTSEGHRAVVLELAREFDDTFNQHIESGEVGGAKMVSSFETSLPQRIRRLPLDDLFELAAIKKLVEEADGYQPYLLSPEKGLRALVKKCLDLAKPPSLQCVDEVHRTLLEVVSAAAAATPGLSRYPPLRRCIVELASGALDAYRLEAKTMVVALVDMERSFIHPTKFRKLVQRRLEKLAYEEDMKETAKTQEQSLLSKITGRRSTSEKAAEAGKGASLKEQKEAASSKSTPPTTPTKEANNTQTGFVSGQEMIAGYLWKKSSDSNSWSKRWFVLNGKIGRLAYMKKPEDKYFRGVVKLEECIVEELVDREDLLDGPESSGSTGPEPGKDGKPTRQVLKSSSSLGQAQTLAFRITNKTPYKSVVKVHNSLLLRAENAAEKQEWVSKMRAVAARASGAKEVESDADSGYDNEEPPAAAAPPVRAVRPADPDAELRLMGSEVRDYVDAVLENLAANIPKAVVFCQIERAKETLLNKLYSGISAQADTGIDGLLQEDGEVRQQRERFMQQNDALKKLQRQLSMQEAKVAIEGGPDPGAEPVEDNSWRTAFRDAGQDGSYADVPPSPVANGGSLPKSRMSREYSEPVQREAPAPPQVSEPQPPKSKSRWGF